MKKNKKPALRRVFKAPVELAPDSAQKILFLSRCLVHLWNMAQAECERRLDQARDVRMAAAEIWETGGSAVYGDTVIGWPEAEELLRNLGTTSISLNFWLTLARRQTIRLGDGTEVRLDSISSDLEREVLRKLAGSYKSFFALKQKQDFRARKPEPKQEDWFQTMSWSSFRIKDGVLMVPGHAGVRIEIPLRAVAAGHSSPGDYLSRNIAGKKVVFVTLGRDRYTGQFMLSLTVSRPLPEQAKGKLFRAIDLGAGDIAVTQSDGSEYLIRTRRPDKFWLRPIAAVEERQNRMVKGSRKWRRLAEGVPGSQGGRRYMHGRSGRQKIDHQKKVAGALVAGDVGCIIVGKGETRLGLSRTKDGTAAQHYGTQNTGYLFRILLYLKSKAEERGINFIELPDPRRKGTLADPSSKFFASRELLRQGLVRAGADVSYPTKFQLKEFSIDFGKGQPPKSASR